MDGLKVLNDVRDLLPRLFELAEAGELNGDYWFDLATCRELLAGVVEAHEENS
jgi:hypothetical protein